MDQVTNCSIVVTEGIDVSSLWDTDINIIIIPWHGTLDQNEGHPEVCLAM